MPALELKLEYVAIHPYRQIVICTYTYNCMAKFSAFSFSLQNEKVEALRIPLAQDTAPAEDCFDQIVALLKATSASTPIVFNCQAGISR